MGKRILVADDSVTIQKAFTMVFSGQDVSLAGARSLDEALTSARHTRPDLIIADANLGTKSGYDLCQAVKGDAVLRDVPVYILASTHVPYDEGRGQKAGAAGHFLKPFESTVIVERILQTLAGPGGGEATAHDIPASLVAQVLARRESSPAKAAAPVAKPAAQKVFEDDEDSYGEISIEHAAPAAPAPRPAAPAPAPMASAPRPTAPPLSTGLRPSLIPGAQPTLSARAAALATPASTAAAKAANSRTIMGLPAMMPPASGAPVPAQARGFAPAPAAVAPAPRAQPFSKPFSQPVSLPIAAPVAQPAAAPVVAAVTSAVAAKISEISARGPEYEAIAKLSREMIEQVVWEVVPELAELIIRQEVDRLAKK